jgi:hypothetical protein
MGMEHILHQMLVCEREERGKEEGKETLSGDKEGNSEKSAKKNVRKMKKINDNSDEKNTSTDSDNYINQQSRQCECIKCYTEREELKDPTQKDIDHSKINTQISPSHDSLTSVSPSAPSFVFSSHPTSTPLAPKMMPPPSPSSSSLLSSLPSSSATPKLRPWSVAGSKKVLVSSSSSSSRVLKQQTLPVSPRPRTSQMIKSPQFTSLTPLPSSSSSAIAPPSSLSSSSSTQSIIKDASSPSLLPFTPSFLNLIRSYNSTIISLFNTLIFQRCMLALWKHVFFSFIFLLIFFFFTQSGGNFYEVYHSLSFCLRKMLGDLSGEMRGVRRGRRHGVVGEMSDVGNISNNVISSLEERDKLDSGMDYCVTES